MLATKGRLKVALLGYCGVLVVGLGMYGAFQEQDAQAHIPGKRICRFYGHRDVTGTATGNRTDHYESAIEACPYCGSQAYVTWSIDNVYEMDVVATMHMSGNVMQIPECHFHITNETFLYQEVNVENVDCSSYSCGG